MLRKYRLSLIIIFLFQALSANAQSTLTGVIVDGQNKIFLPFVNIGIRHKNIGTASQNDGSFSIKIPQQNLDDTISFSMIGYEDLHLPVKNIISSGQKQFTLNPKAIELATVIVPPKKLVEKKLGIVKYHPVLHFTDASLNQNDIFEIAQLIKLDTTLTKITSVNLHINAPRIDSGTFRINFYGYDGKNPTNRLTEKSIIQTHAITEGWLKFDLKKYNIYLKGNVVVAIEFIPSTKSKNNPIYYEVKLGGSSKSFVRTSSQGEWATPPAHYRMFITALAEDKKNKKDADSDENEAIPATRLFSTFVKDSFSIFINLPKDYTKKKSKKYPVIYLTDANAFFDVVASSLNEKSAPGAILIGIGYKDAFQMDSLRERDYTYPKALQKDNWPVSGGANEFLSFIKNELSPYIDKTYRTDTLKRTLMGHSLGGYFTLYALLTDLQEKQFFFNNYLSASPSLEYSDKYLLKQFKNNEGGANNSATVFITCGEAEDREEGGTTTEGLDDFNDLVKQLSEDKYKNIKLKSKIFPKLGHMATAIPSFTEILKELK